MKDLENRVEEKPLWLLIGDWLHTIGFIVMILFGIGFGIVKLGPPGWISIAVVVTAAISIVLLFGSSRDDDDRNPEDRLTLD